MLSKSHSSATSKCAKKRRDRPLPSVVKLDGDGNPLCVRGFDIDEKTGERAEVWCVCTFRDPAALNSKTLCDMVVVMPGMYKHQQPTCRECQLRFAALPSTLGAKT